MTNLLERAAELALIWSTAEAVRTDQRGRMIIFEGPAGIGKSSVLSQARAEAHRRGFTPIAAAGKDLEQEYAWGLVKELFQPVVAGRDDIVTSTPAAAAAVELVGTGDLDVLEHVGEYSLVHSLLWLTQELAGRRPLLITVDDLHWSDVPSLRFLIYLAGRFEALPVLVVGAARPAADRVEHLLLSLTSGPGVSTRTLSPLSPAATGQLLARAMGREPGRALVDRCHGLTHGNALLAAELARQVARAQGSGEIEDIVRRGVPSIERYVRLQLSRLPAAAQETARALTMLGDRVPVRHITAVAGLPARSVLDSLSLLQGEGLLSPSDQSNTVHLTHPVVRASIYDAMNPSQRAHLHARAGREALAEPDVELAATHLLRVPPGVADIDAVPVLRAAADRSAARGAVHSAVAYLVRCLHLMSRDDEARPVASDNLALARAWGTPRAIGRALRVAATVEPRERQLDLLEESVSVLRDSAALLERAESELALGDALRRDRRTADAQPHLQAAVELADACGARPLRQSATGTMRLFGARPKTFRLGPTSLTQGEQRVVDLAVTSP